MGVGYLGIVSRLVIIQHHIGYCINLDFLAIFFDMDCDDDPTLVGRREALKVAYSRLQPCHPTLPPALKDFQVLKKYNISWCRNTGLSKMEVYHRGH